MDIDLDPLDDMFADEPVKNARPVGKFQPKAKFRPSKKNLATTSVSSSQAVQAIDTAKSELNEPIRITKPSENCSDVVPDDNGGSHVSMEKAVGESAVELTGLEAIGDFLSHPTTADTEVVAPPPEVALGNAFDLENAIRKLASPEQSAHLDPLTAGDPIISISDGCGHTDNRGFERVEMDVMDYINMSDLTAESGQRTGIFHPKPKKQMQEEMCKASESISYSHDAQSLPPETTFTERDLVHIQHDDVNDISDLGFSQSLPVVETSEPRLNGESVNFMETETDPGIDLEGVPEIPAKLASRRAKAPLDPSPHQQNSSTSTQENGTGRSLRPRKGKANLCQLIDEAEDDEVHASADISEEYIIEDENLVNEEELQAENEPKTKKKAKRKSKKPDGDKEKPARKRKKAEEASDKPPADPKPKKFSHSTRRRRVDKVLLETPEDDIDYQRVPLRDLILLAEHKERQTKKDEAAAAAAAAVAAQASTQSNVNGSDPYNEDENLTSEQGGEYNDGETPPIVEDSTAYFNYQTYMDKTPIARWSKQDTEVFYEAIRQFGTDLSMIQQLFPGRTRRQVKLKYKKEERQHPLRLREALTTRTKDHSHFETVIERLKKMAAEERQNAEKEDSIDLTGNEVDEEGTSHADDDEAAKDEHVEEVEEEDVVANEDTTEVGSDLKSDDAEEEDDLFLWSQYKSDA